MQQGAMASEGQRPACNLAPLSRNSPRSPGAPQVTSAGAARRTPPLLVRAGSNRLEQSSPTPRKTYKKLCTLASNVNWPTTTIVARLPSAKSRQLSPPVAVPVAPAPARRVLQVLRQQPQRGAAQRGPVPMHAPSSSSSSSAAAARPARPA